MASKESIAALTRYLPTVGAITGARPTFDLSGWGDHPPLGVPHVVMTHNSPEEWQKEVCPTLL